MWDCLSFVGRPRINTDSHTHMTIYTIVKNSMHTRSAWWANQSSVHLLYDHIARGSKMAKPEEHSDAM
jgi:hypothetical protein